MQTRGEDLDLQDWDSGFCWLSPALGPQQPLQLPGSGCCPALCQAHPWVRSCWAWLSVLLWRKDRGQAGPSLEPAGPLTVSQGSGRAGWLSRAGVWPWAGLLRGC